MGACFKRVEREERHAWGVWMRCGGGAGGGGEWRREADALRGAKGKAHADLDTHHHHHHRHSPPTVEPATTLPTRRRPLPGPWRGGWLPEARTHRRPCRPHHPHVSLPPWLMHITPPTPPPPHPTHRADPQDRQRAQAHHPPEVDPPPASPALVPSPNPNPILLLLLLLPLRSMATFNTDEVNILVHRYLVESGYSHAGKERRGEM